MIEYIKGNITELTPTQTIIECNGIGYALNISLNTYSSLQGKKEAKLYVYEAIREDAHLLYGFTGKQERELFLLLISVSGIGGNTARMILSAYPPSELCDIITSGNDKLLKSVKGIGLKTAQRVIVDLKDKISLSKADSGSSLTMTQHNPDDKRMEEAMSALTMLGFSPAPTQKTIVAILKDQPELPVESIIKQALKML